jgi:hypothetical protein
MPNEQIKVPLFTAGEVLTAANMNLSAGTGVPVFANTTTRDAGFGGAGEKVLAEGQLCYLSDSNIVQYYTGSAWATVGPASSGVVQVKNTFKSDTFSTSSTSYTDVTGLSIAITPTSASNKVLVSVTANLATDGSSVAIYYRIMRDATAIAIGDAAGSRTRATGNAYPNGGIATSVAMDYLDSPATTSATTYKVQVIMNGAGTGYLNRNNSDSDAVGISRVVSTITVMEVAP